MVAEPVDQLAYVRSLRAQNLSLSAENEALKHGGGGGTLPPMETVDAKIAAAEARTDTKFAELRGDLKDFATKGTVWSATATIIASLVATFLAVLAFGGDRFDAGVGAGGALAPYAEQQRARDAQQDAQFREILKRLPAPAATSAPKR